ncbi:hypothetical protein CBL_11712 [Carabus blaptoides fortunei]
MDTSYNIQEDDEIRLMLKELQIEKDKYETENKSRTQLEHISVICFTRNVQSIVDKLFRVSVKIYNSLSDINILDMSNSIDHENNNNCKYYLVQIHTSQLLQSNLINDNWIANICVRSDEYSVSRTVALKKLIPSDTFNIIVPFCKSIKDATIETRFFSPLANYWPNLKLSCVNTDISHHFIPIHEHRLFQREQQSALFEISKLYTEEIKLKTPEALFEYTFNCKTDVRHFYEMILKNCVHRLDINHMQLLATSIDGTATVNLTVDDTNSSIMLDTNNKMLKIYANAEILHRIKLFLISNFQNEHQSNIFDDSVLNRLSELKLDLDMAWRNQPINLDVMKQFYQEYKNIISQIPI